MFEILHDFRLSYHLLLMLSLHLSLLEIFCGNNVIGNQSRLNDCRLNYMGRSWLKKTTDVLMIVMMFTSARN